ncbi:MAG TPA: HIT domain-containing protein, partial [Candidatus Saccharimonadia bacterium]|nr:HIT domain-containing protein [Candidatus Saccharimonadia bacterium]
RLTINHGKNAGETVPHMHMHLLAGRELGWPPG